MDSLWRRAGNLSWPAFSEEYHTSSILLASAMLFREFEIEMLPRRHRGRLEMDMRYYGLGVLPPRGEVPFRVRRRRGLD